MGARALSRPLPARRAARGGRSGRDARDGGFWCRCRPIRSRQRRPAQVADRRRNPARHPLSHLPRVSHRRLSVLHRWLRSLGDRSPAVAVREGCRRAMPSSARVPRSPTTTESGAIISTGTPRRSDRWGSRALRAVKAELDPAGILNPGALIPIDAGGRPDPPRTPGGAARALRRQRAPGPDRRPRLGARQGGSSPARWRTWPTGAVRSSSTWTCSTPISSGRGRYMPIPTRWATCPRGTGSGCWRWASTARAMIALTGPVGAAPHGRRRPGAAGPGHAPATSERPNG